MITIEIGTSDWNEGVEFFSTPDAKESHECAIWDEECGVWHWCDDQSQTDEQRARTRAWRIKQLSVMRRFANLDAEAAADAEQLRASVEVPA